MSAWWMGWQHRAACREQSSLFFPDDPDETREDRRARETRAKAICGSCDVRRECLAYALRAGESHGVWGGLNEYERRMLQRERRAG